MFLSIPPKLSLSEVMQRVKGRSSRRIQKGVTQIEEAILGQAFFGARMFLDNLGQCDRRHQHAVLGITFRQMILSMSIVSPSLGAAGLNPMHAAMTPSCTFLHNV
jgi:hypothetical protein